MTRWIVAFIVLTACCAQAGDAQRPYMEERILCSDSWYQFIENAVVSSDNQGHGPDIGSDEWPDGRAPCLARTCCVIGRVVL